MHFCFDPKKAIQAAAALLRMEEARQMPYLRLLKLLYIADRESIRDIGRPITGDQAIAMKQGPVPEGVYKLIKGEHYNSPNWSRYFQTSGYWVKLTGEAEVGTLSEYELEKLREVAERYANKDEFEIVDATHEFEEWKKNWSEQGVRPIPAEDILRAVGREQDIEQIEQEQKARVVFDKVFGG
jgi:uncharacterized phage-associated protein